ncbi:MAG: DNA gyrase inhibitor YacG [Pseudomonadota bacterium]
MSETAPPERKCPVCGKPQVEATRPFCSKRCADVDLHRWLGGHYAIPVVEEDGGAEEREDPDAR